MQEIAIFIMSIITSFISVMLGIAAGNFNVPLMVLLLDTEFKKAATASLITVTIAALSASLYNHKKRMIDYKVSSMLILPLIIGASMGPFIPLQNRQLEIIFGAKAVILVFAAIMLEGGIKSLFGARLRNREIILIAFLTGVLASMMGIGGGIIIVPLLAVPFGMQMKKAVATSTFVMIFTTSIAFISQTLNGNFDIGIALPMALPVIFTGYAGAYFMNNRTTNEQLKRFFEVVLILLSLAMLFK